MSGSGLDGSRLGLADSLRGRRRIEWCRSESMLQLQATLDADEWVGLDAVRLGPADSPRGIWWAGRRDSESILQVHTTLHADGWMDE